MNSESSIASNHDTLDALQKLFFSEDKPSHLKPVDIAVTAYLLLRRTADHSIYDSYFTIAQRVCSDKKTVARSLSRLQDLNWVTVGGRGRGRSKGLSIQIEKLPAAQPLRAKITDDAKKLAYRYYEVVKSQGPRRFPKNWIARQEPSAQRILTSCGGDLILAKAIVSHAFNNLQFKKRAVQSLYHLLSVWKAVTESYQEKLKQKGVSNNEQQCNATA